MFLIDLEQSHNENETKLPLTIDVTCNMQVSDRVIPEAYSWSQPNQFWKIKIFKREKGNRNVYQVYQKNVCLL